MDLVSLLIGFLRSLNDGLEQAIYDQLFIVVVVLS